MSFYVYLIVTFDLNKILSYVGYTIDLKKRLKLHNSSKGAKFTRGKKWLLAYKKGYKSKSKALKEEYSLKKDRKRRNKIKNEFIYKNPHLFNKSTQL
mgnify:CR=1 FL=1